MIPAEIICTHHNIDTSFIFSLEAAGLIATSRQQEAVYIHSSQLDDLEKFILFHYQLDINLEGIEAIAGLLQTIRSMQEEMAELKRKLRAFD